MVTNSAWKYRLVQLVADRYSVQEVMDLLNLDDEYVIKNCLKDVVVRNIDSFLEEFEEAKGDEE